MHSVGELSKGIETPSSPGVSGGEKPGEIPLRGVGESRTLGEEPPRSKANKCRDTIAISRATERGDLQCEENTSPEIDRSEIGVDRTDVTKRSSPELTRPGVEEHGSALLRLPLWRIG